MIYDGYKSVSCQCDIVFHLLEGTPPFCVFPPFKSTEDLKILKVKVSVTTCAIESRLHIIWINSSTQFR